MRSYTVSSKKLHSNKIHSKTLSAESLVIYLHETTFPYSIRTAVINSTTEHKHNGSCVLRNTNNNEICQCTKTHKKGKKHLSLIYLKVVSVTEILRMSSFLLSHKLYTHHVQCCSFFVFYCSPQHCEKHWRWKMSITLLSSQLGVGVGPDLALAAEGSVTRCSSIRLACERMMRLKKSSSGTVGPRAGGGGGAQRWSSRREPWKIKI